MPTISIDGKTCFYQDRGEGYPVLLGHSYLWTSDMWEPQLQSLSKEFRCIAVDLWDHGQSGSIGTNTYSVEQLAEDYWKLMQHLEIPEFAMIGLSVGGMWGAHLALNHPEALRALVLMDTYVGSEPQITQQRYFGLLDLLEKIQCFTKEILDQIVPMFFSPYTYSHQPHLVQAFRESLMSIKKENFAGIVALGRVIFSRKCLLDRLPQLMQPTLVLAGKDDMPRPPREAEEMARLIPNAILGIIENAGHISNLEQPGEVTSLLVNFLEKADSLKTKL